MFGRRKSSPVNAARKVLVDEGFAYGIAIFTQLKPWEGYAFYLAHEDSDDPYWVGFRKGFDHAADIAYGL